jgi:hypothetical protein
VPLTQVRQVIKWRDMEHLAVNDLLWHRLREEISLLEAVLQMDRIDIVAEAVRRAQSQSGKLSKNPLSPEM